MSLTVGELSAFLTVKDQGFTQGINQAQKSFDGLVKTADQGLAKVETSAGKTGKALDFVGKHEASLNQLTGTTGKLGLALTAAATGAVLMSSNFEQGMSSVKATGDDARKNFAELRKAAIEAGADTKYSATEAAGAIEELSKAGVSASDVLSGGLSGSLNLAAAGGLAVADAAGIASVALTQFKLGGKDVGHVADLLAAGAGKAMGGVDDLGMALKQGGLVASQFGLTIEETVGGLSAFASAGLLGSDAGTSFKSMLQRLTPDSKEAQAQFDALGVSAFDAQGQFVGLAQFSGQLQNALKDLSPEARASALEVMFGADAVRAASVLYEQGEEGIRGWIEAVDDSGYAAKTAATMNDNLAGDLEALGGSFETLMIGMGDGANGPLRAVVQALDAVVDSANGLPDPIKQGLLLFTGAGGLTALAVAGLGKMVTSISNVRGSLQAMNITMKAATLSAGAIGVALVVGTTAIMSWAQQAAEAKQRTEGYADSLDTATGAISDYTRELAAKNLQESGAFDAARKMGINLQLVTDAAMGNADALKEVTRLTDEYYNSAATAAEGVSLDSLKFWEKSDIEDARETTTQLTNAIGVEADALADAKSKQQEKNEATKDSIPASESAAAAAENVAGAYQNQAEATEEAWKALQAWSDGIAGLENAEMAYEEAVDDVGEAVKRAAEDFTEAERKRGEALTATTDKGRENRRAMIGLRDDTWAYVESLREQGATQEELEGVMEAGREQFINAARDMGMSKKAAEAWADSLKLIPAEVGVAVDFDISNAESRAAALTAMIEKSGEDVSTWTISADGTSAISEAEDTVITIDEKTGEIKILGDNAQAFEEAAEFINRTNNSSATVNVDASVGAADSAISDLIRRREQEVINIRVQADTTYSPAHSSTSVKRSSGGSVFGPGTGTSDEIPAWLSNGEHVLTAREVQAMGGHGSVERWRRAALAGNLPAFAYGGAVTDAEKSLNSINAKITKQKKVVSKETGDVKAAQKTYDGIDGKKANAGAKKKAKANLEAQKKQLKKEEKELDELRDERDDIKDQIKRLKDDSREASRDARRGNIRDSVTGGLNSAYGIVDELWDQSRNTDLSKKKREAAGKAAQQLEADLVKAYAQADALATKMESAKDDLAELANIQAGVKSILGSEFTLSDSIKAATEATTVLVQKTNEAGDSWYQVEEKAATSANFIATDALANITGKVSRVKEFTGKINKLAALGISGVLLAEIGKEGIEGGILMADALLADPVTAKALSGAYADLDAATSAAGAAVTQNSTVNGQFYAGGVTQAETAVKDIQKSIDAVNQTIADLAKGAETAILSALGLKKDKNGKVVAKAAGGPVVGPGTGTSDSIPALLSNGEHIITAAEVQAAGGHGAVEKWRTAMKAGRLNENRLHTVQTLPPVATQIVVNQTPAGMTRAEMEAAIEAGITRGVAAIAAAAERGTASGSYKALTGAASDITTLTRMGGN